MINYTMHAEIKIYEMKHNLFGIYKFCYKLVVTQYLEYNTFVCLASPLNMELFDELHVHVNMQIDA